MSKVCTPAYLDGLRYFLTSMTARHHENERPTRKHLTWFALRRSLCSLLLVVRSLIESHGELLSFCSTYKCTRHSRLTHTKSVRYNILSYLYLRGFKLSQCLAKRHYQNKKSCILYLPKITMGDKKLYRKKRTIVIKKKDWHVWNPSGY